MPPATVTNPEPFRPRRGLRGGHLQTLIGAFLPPQNALPAPELRCFCVDAEAEVLTLCHWQPDRRRCLTLLIVHGLEGSANSSYVLGTASKAWQAGMNVVRYNVRNCGGTEHLCRTLYHSGLSADVGEVVRALIRDDRLGRIALAGFSMGGNQVLKLAGEWGSSAPPQLEAVAAVSPGIDLAACADAIHRWKNRIYEWNFLWNLRRTLRRKALCFPGKVQVGGWGDFRSIRDFDNRVTAPAWGFADANDYYTRASASAFLPRIAVPTLMIQAADDPFVSLTGETRARIAGNPNIRLIETEHGGHCAFLAAPDRDDGRWAERQVVNFVSRF
ncbi:MAG TPA: alpha/beta fold hydrolase [Terriglobia bacterium]|nr:alpha/beta fold hydrolase [Terriglobia bacterium]